MDYIYIVMAERYSADYIICAFFTEEEANQLVEQLDFIYTKVVKVPVLTSAYTFAGFSVTKEA